MKVVDFSKTNSILNQYVSEIRNVEVQNDRLRFRRNIERIGEIMAYEMSKEFTYSVKNIRTPLGIAPVSTPDNQLVISTILRAGLPFHQGFLSYFDGAENAFVSAYRKYKDTLKFDIHIEYIASPRIIASQQAIEHIKNIFPEDKTIIWCAAIDPEINEHSYIVPGLGDAGDLAYGEKE